MTSFVLPRMRRLALPSTDAPILAAALALTSGLLGWLAGYPRPIPWLDWVAPVPVLVVALRCGPRSAIWLGGLWGLGATLGCWQFFEPAFMPRAAVVQLIVSSTIAMTVVLVLTVTLARATSLAFAGWIFAFATAFAQWTTQPAGIGLWSNTATTQVSVGWLRAIAAVGGPYLVSLLVTLGSGSLAAVIVAGRRAVFSVTMAGVVLGTAVVAGRLATPVATRSTRVAAVVHGLPRELANRWDVGVVRSEETQSIVDAYATLTRRAAAAGAKVVVWPEYGVSLLPEDLPAWRTRMAALARETDTIVVAGFIDVGARENNSLLVTPAGDVEVYTKQHLVPGFETSRFEAGNLPFGEVSANGLRVATRICFDGAFTAGSRAAARAGVDVLAVPARHWAGIQEVYPMWQVYRAAENGLAMVQAVRDGWSMIVDPTGRVLASQSSFDHPEVLLVGDLPVARGGSFYSGAGDWPVAASALGLTALALAAIVRGRAG